jgi:hypothetical protein
VRVTRKGESVRVRLSLAEAHVLEQLLLELQATLDPGALDPTDPVRLRLYPAAYDDDRAAADYREITEAGLQRERSDRLDACLAELRAARSVVRTDLALDAEAADRWMRVLNDLRLTFGTRLQITDDDDNVLDPDDPDVQLRARYMWLTALQDLLVTTLMG